MSTKTNKCEKCTPEYRIKELERERKEVLRALIELVAYHDGRDKCAEVTNAKYIIEKVTGKSI